MNVNVPINPIVSVFASKRGVSISKSVNTLLEVWLKERADLPPATYTGACRCVYVSERIVGRLEAEALRMGITLSQLVRRVCDHARLPHMDSEVGELVREQEQERSARIKHTVPHIVHVPARLRDQYEHALLQRGLEMLSQVTFNVRTSLPAEPTVPVRAQITPEWLSVYHSSVLSNRVITTAAMELALAQRAPEATCG